MEQKQQTQLTNDGLLKYGVTKKTLFTGLSIIAGVGLIAIISFLNAVFSPEKLKTWTYWAEVAISVGICIYGMVTGLQLGDDLSRTNQKGAFKKVVAKYFDIYSLICAEGKKYFAFFSDWLTVYKERLLKNKQEEVLKSYGVYQMEVLCLDRNELDSLTQPYKKDWHETQFVGKFKDDTTYFLSYTEEQIAAIKACMDGQIKVSDIPHTFFESVYDSTAKDMWESAAHAEKKKALYIVWNYAYKIAALIAMSILLNGLIPGSKDGAAGLLSFGGRLITLITSVIWGIYVGYEVVKIEVTYIEFKTIILNQFYTEVETKVFVPKTLEEKAKEAYDKKEMSEPHGEQEKLLD